MWKAGQDQPHLIFNFLLFANGTPFIDLATNKSIAFHTHLSNALHNTHINTKKSQTLICIDRLDICKCSSDR